MDIKSAHWSSPNVQKARMVGIQLRTIRQPSGRTAVSNVRDARLDRRM